ncbi:MAG: ABC transporter substrate-binding protein [Fibrobacterota bacterium]|nr:ABC transporter substrate-binding protein [Fibrobacterota bacterium]QQS04551.1 MAG: ABC transporter substrate-binding protein [Fibrobacterota bacterium]
MDPVGPSKGGATRQMTLDKRKWLWAACIVVVAMAIGWLAFGRSAERTPLRIGINPWPGYEHLYLAKVLGLYKEAGVDVEIVEFNSLLDARRAFERGQIHGLGTTATDIALSLGQSSSAPRIVQVVDFSNGGDLLLADSAIKSFQDLRGKRIGLESGSVSSYVLARALVLNGMNGSDITTIASDQTSLLEEFAKGNIDAIVTYPPFSVKILSTGRARSLFTSAAIPHEVLDVIAFDAGILERRPDDVRGILGAYWKARKAAEDAPRTNVAIMARREGISDSEFAASLRNDIQLVHERDQPSYLGPEGKLKAVLLRADSVLRREGFVKGPPRLDSAVFTDPRLQKDGRSPK